MTVTVGSLCTGIGGLEHGLTLAGLNMHPVFVSDIDPGACAWLEANSTAPNLGDFTALDELPPVDILTAGFPCQPLSLAGQRKGLEDDRWLFDDICRLVSRMGTRPVVFLENVPGLLTANDGHAMAAVVHGLAAIGYRLDYGLMEAAAVGAPHRRRRWWGIAMPENAGIGRGQDAVTDADSAGSETRQHTRRDSQQPRLQPVGFAAFAADPDGGLDDAQTDENRPDSALRRVRRGAGEEALREAVRRSDSIPQPNDMRTEMRKLSRNGNSRGPSRKGQETPIGEMQRLWSDDQFARTPHRPRPDEQSPGQRHDAVRFMPPETPLGRGSQCPNRCGQAWGSYQEAVERWCLILGRCAPAPTDKGRLSARATEWMMGYPAGWVTDTLTNRRQALHALGNAVVPQCAAAAFTQLSARI